MNQTTPWRRLGAALAGAATALACATAITACGGGGDAAGSAQIRLVNLSSSRSTFDLVAVDDDDETALAASVAADAASDRADVGAGERRYELRRAGNDSAAASSSWSLTQDTLYSAIAYGSDSNLKIAMLEEDEDTPDSGKARVRIYNTSSDSGALDVYLTDDDTALDDASITTTVAAGGSSGFVTLSSGSFRLRLTGSGDTADLRLDAADVAIGSGSVVTIVLTAGEGGVLVHAATLVQDGGLAVFRNGSARVRVAAGVTGNASIDASVGGAVLASAQRAPSVGAYRLVGAGSALSLSTAVDGAALAAQSLTLKAGGDYTLVVSGTAADATATLLTDDNHLPASGSAKVRLVNAMADVIGGLTLSVDYAALADDVAVGGASSYATLTAVSDVPLEVTSPLATEALFSIAEADLTSKNVYTVFMLGGTDSPYGLLRKDR